MADTKYKEATIVKDDPGLDVWTEEDGFFTSVDEFLVLEITTGNIVEKIRLSKREAIRLHAYIDNFLGVI